jgi:hypothetical protein
MINYALKKIISIIIVNLGSTSSWRNVKRSCTSNLNFPVNFLFVFLYPPGLKKKSSATGKRVLINEFPFPVLSSNRFFFAV